MALEDLMAQLGIPLEDIDDMKKFAQLLKKASPELKAQIKIILQTVELTQMNKNKKRHKATF